MEIAFASRRIWKLCCNASAMRAELGAPIAAMLQQRLWEMRAADTLDDLGQVPGASSFSLNGERLTVHLANSMHLSFKPNHDPMPRDAGGGLDVAQVTSVLVMKIVGFVDAVGSEGDRRRLAPNQARGDAVVR